MSKEERNDPLFECLLLKNAPGASVRKPRDNVLEFWVREDHVKLHRKGGFLVSGAGLGNLGSDVREVVVRAFTIVVFLEKALECGLRFFRGHFRDSTVLAVAIALWRRLAVGGRWRSCFIGRGSCSCEGVHCEKGVDVEERRSK
jgi:hypothetical protein